MNQPSELNRRHSITKSTLAARRVLILAFGSHKTALAFAMVRGPVGDGCPASFLQKHPRVHTLLDEAAEAQLNGAR